MPAIFAKAYGSLVGSGTLVNKASSRIGCSVALGIDGSKGPRRKAKPGAVSLAKHSGCSIVPCYGFSDRSWRFNTWDRFVLPKPWARMTLVYGDPIPVPEDVSGDNFVEIQSKIGRSIDTLEKEHLPEDLISELELSSDVRC